MNIGGSICALVTPFTADGALDVAAFGRLLDFQLDGGCQGIVIAGSTGEAHMLERDEFERLLAFAVERVAGRVPVIAGTGEAGTAKTVALTRRVKALGVDAALVVTPYYVRPTQEGLRRHFLQVAEQGGLPIVVYNVAARTACDLKPETLATLRDHPAIVGVKEASSADDRIRACAELARPDFVYLSGDDGSAAKAMLAGAAGTISVVANIAPRPFRLLCDAAIAGNRAQAARCDAILAPLVHALTCASNPISVKAGLPWLGLGTAMPRLPLVELEGGPDRARIYQALAGLASLVKAA